MNYPDSVLEVIEHLKKLPGVGEKTAERYALYLLEENNENVGDFLKSIEYMKSNIKKCIWCNSYCDDILCEVCKDGRRNKKSICVVNDPKTIYLFEKMRIFKGNYYVLDSLISPLNGIGPDDININKLFELIERSQVNEVIFALKQSIEGETTALYISKILENKNIKISKIASGVPMGVDMSYIDEFTLTTAFNNRIEL